MGREELTPFFSRVIAMKHRKASASNFSLDTPIFCMGKGCNGVGCGGRRIVMDDRNLKDSWRN
jgi:hypothetical protein